MANVSTSSSSHEPYPVSEELQLPMNLSKNDSAPDIPATPNMATMWPATPGAQSPMSRWFDGSPSNACQGESPLKRWLQGAPRAGEAYHADVLQKHSPFAMGPECSHPGQMYLASFNQPLMRPVAPMMAIAICPPISTTQSTGQTNVTVPPQAMPQQQAMPIWTRQFSPEASSGDAATTNPMSTESQNGAESGVWSDMAAWKAQQSGIGEKAFVVDQNLHGMIKRRPDWNERKLQCRMPNQKSMQPRGRTAISKKPADTADSVGPRAVFVDLSKIVPTGMISETSLVG